MESHSHSSKERTSDLGHVIKGFHYPGVMGEQNWGGKDSQYPPSHLNHSDWLHRTTGFSNMFDFEGQHVSKRRLGWFWIATCVVATFLVSMASSRTPLAAPVQKFNRTDEVQFDSYSLVLRGQRVFLQYVTILHDAVASPSHWLHHLVLESFTPSVYQYRLYGLTSSRKSRLRV
jgi:hypothetical protein